MINYHNRLFRSVASTDNAEVDHETLFQYRQEGAIVYAEYAGGAIVRGQLLGVADENGIIDLRYQQINTSGALMTGRCRSTPELLPDGRIRLHEDWQWTSGDGARGSSTVEEVRE